MRYHLFNKLILISCLLFHFSCKSIENNSISNTSDLSVVKDIDGNEYNVVEINGQYWMAENLRTTTFKNGLKIGNAMDDTIKNMIFSPFYCWYNNSYSYKSKYGGLYNWYAVNTGNLCPDGWHVPTDEDWSLLTSNLGYESKAGDKLKETNFNYWNKLSTGATNETGFSALPGGNFFGNNFNHMGDFGYWWTATESDKNYAWYRSIYGNTSGVERRTQLKTLALSVRCIKTNNQHPVASFSLNKDLLKINEGIFFEDKSTNNPIKWHWDFGDGTYSNERNINHTYKEAGEYNVQLMVENEFGINSISKVIKINDSEANTGMVKDIDGNLYNTVKIGSQIWMAENLKVTRFSNGNIIPEVKKNQDWKSLSSPGLCWYENDKEKYGDKFGALYNWYAASTEGLCPSGWHVANDDEWSTLINYLGGEKEASFYLRESGYANWERPFVEPKTPYDNESGFTALPGGFREYYGLFKYNGTNAAWWTSTESYDVYGWIRVIQNNSGGIIFRTNNLKKFGYSIRCIKD